MDAARDPADSLGLDPDVVAVGRREIERIKAELGRRATRSRPAVHVPKGARAPSAAPAVDDMSADRIAAEMASAAERDHLLDRIRALEAEVAHLRDAMASIMETAAGGVRPPRHR